MTRTPEDVTGGDKPKSVSHGFHLDVVELLRWPGTQRHVELDEAIEGLETSAARAQTVRGTLLVESMSDSFSIVGVLQLGWQGACRRCLEETVGSTDVAVSEIYERGSTEGETFEIEGDSVDLQPMVRELGLLALPLAPLCAEDCEGPAPDAYPAAVESGSTDEEEPPGDPRWAALDELIFEGEERNPPGSR